MRGHRSSGIRGKKNADMRLRRKIVCQPLQVGEQHVKPERQCQRVPITATLNRLASVSRRAGHVPVNARRCAASQPVMRRSCAATSITALESRCELGVVGC